MIAGRTPSHSAEEPENPATRPNVVGIVDGSQDVMVVEIPPSMTAEKTGGSGDSADVPSATSAKAVKQFTAGRMDSTEVPPGVTAAMAVTGKQSTSESSETDSTVTRQSSSQ